MRTRSRSLARDEEGATALEYAIMASFVAAAVAVAVQLVGQKISALFTTFSSMF
ncbi:MAG TPA: Flp family type IVb pilin [Anaeromyxobacter sp.]|nr:Flp family type IVb pilin [Anaeromyxobacter sp.]